MTKQELEEKIKNKEKVWFVKLNNEIEEGFLHKTIEEDLYLFNDYFAFRDRLFSTKAQAQHYLDNGNVKRVEKLPYITWEEVKKYSDQEFYIIEFYNKNYLNCCIEVNFSFEYISVFEGDLLFKNSRYDLTEENFYKAYKVARKLFLGGNNE